MLLRNLTGIRDIPDRDRTDQRVDLARAMKDSADRAVSGLVAARHAWARANPDRVRGFIRGDLKGLDWTLDPANRAAAAALLMQRMPAIRPGVLDAVMDSLLSPKSGLTPKGAILRDGMATVLALRSRYGAPKRRLTDIDKYLDLSFWEDTIGKGGD